MRIWLVLPLLLIGCGPREGRHKPLAGEGEVVGYDSVRPLFAKYCSSCHPSRSTPDWLDYQQAEAVARSGKLLQRVVVDKSMPPPATAESASIEEKDRIKIAQWVRSGMPMTAPGSRAPSAADKTEAVVQGCFQCHGSNGLGSEPKAARLAGQNREYLATQLTRFKFRERIDPTGRMNDVARPLSADTIEEIARYFSSKPVDAASASVLKPEKRELFARGREMARGFCNGCHMNESFGGRPTSDWLPVLRNQSHTYLLDQLLYFKNRERVNSVMYEFVKDLSYRDIEAVALYYSAGGE